MNIQNRFYILMILFFGLFGSIYIKSSINKESQVKMINNKKIIFTFLSAPGAGKGTLAQLCADELNFSVLSTGDLFRKNIAEETAIGTQLKKIINEGKLVSDDIVISMVKEWLLENKDKHSKIILDGFPRTAIQAKSLLEIIQNDLKDYNFKIIKLDIPNEEIKERLINRRVCPNKECNAVYNTSMPEIKDGKCPKCGTDLIQRNDDKPEIIDERFKIYKKTEKELVSFYESEGLNIEHLNVSHKTPMEIFEVFKAKFLDN